MLFSGKQMKLDIIILTELSLSQKKKYCMLSLFVGSRLTKQHGNGRGNHDQDEERV
jgi:hypothetical protein